MLRLQIWMRIIGSGICMIRSRVPIMSGIRILSSFIREMRRLQSICLSIGECRFHETKTEEFISVHSEDRREILVRHLLIEPARFQTVRDIRCFIHFLKEPCALILHHM